MGKKKGNVVFNSILYTAGNMMLKAFSFFLIPLYTSYLSVEEYGTLNLAGGFYGLVASIITLGLQYGVVRYYADYKEDKNKVAKMFGTVVTFTVFVGILFVALFFVFRDIVTFAFFKGIKFYPVVLLSLLISVVSAIYSIYQDILKGMQDAKLSVCMSYVYFFLLLVGNIVTVVVLKMGSTGVLVSTLLVNILLVITMFVDLSRRHLFVFGVDRQLILELLKYSLPLVPHMIAYNVQTYATKLVINSALSLGVLGLYGLASQFGNVTDVILNSVQSAFQPWMYDVLNKGRETGRIGKITDLLLWVYGIVFMCIGLFSQEAVILMASCEYFDAWKYVPAIVISFAVKCPWYFYINFMYYHKSKTKYVFVSTVIGCVVNILLTWLMVPIWGIYGSILADIIAMCIRVMVTMIVVHREARDIYSFFGMYSKIMLAMFFMIIGLIPAYLKYQYSICAVNILYKCIVILVFAVIVIIINRSFLYNSSKRNSKK